MNHNAQIIINKELASDEKLLWAGMPKQGTIFKGSDVLMVPFSLLWGGFAIFWEYMALTMVPKAQNAPDGFALLFPLFGIPFVVIGLYMIFGRFIYDAKKRARTYYGLTDQRAIIVSGLFSQSVKSLHLKTMSDISLSEKTSGYGSIVFGQENQMMSLLMGSGFPNMNGSTTPQFELIENAKQVFKQLREQQKPA
jgi:hypothetical protein